MSVADDHEAEFFGALGAGDPEAVRLFDHMANPPQILGRGYFIPDTRPGAVNYWRRLGDTSRPLAQLAAFERTL